MVLSHDNLFLNLGIKKAVSIFLLNIAGPEKWNKLNVVGGVNFGKCAQADMAGALSKYQQLFPWTFILYGYLIFN